MTITMIEELRRLEAEATPGRWQAVKAAHGPVDVFDPRGHDITTMYGSNRDANAALIVAMRNALPELLKALEEAQALLRRVPSALNGAFMAGTEEREGGSARRQDKYAKEGDDLRREIPEFLNSLPPHGGVDVG